MNGFNRNETKPEKALMNRNIFVKLPRIQPRKVQKKKL